MGSFYGEGETLHYGDHGPAVNTAVRTRQGDILEIIRGGVVYGPGAMRWDCWDDIEPRYFPMDVVREP